jgi:5-methyltetrahydrofolate--homocysteine methyltransferase
LHLAGSGYIPAQLISAGISNVKKAIASANSSAKIALDIGSLGKLLAPVGDLPFEEAIDIFAEMVRAGADADLILIETMNDTCEIKAAMLAAKENSDLPIMVTFSPDEQGRLLTGADITTAAVMIEALGATAVGLNCGFGPLQMKDLAHELCAAVSIPVIFSPNGGMPKIINGKTVFDLAPADYATQVTEIAKIGGSIFGGCCGTTPAHIGEMIKTLKDMQGFHPRTPTLFLKKEGQKLWHKNHETAQGAVSNDRGEGEWSPSAVEGATPLRSVPRSCILTSYSQTVTLGGGEIVIIGERINPTGKPRLKKALREGDMSFVCNEALVQVGQGACLLDVNVGLPGIDEKEMLVKAVTAVQGVTSVPLVIDTSDIRAAEEALRVYNGKPLLNSVNGKRESLETVLPLAKKYGAALVALALDDNGIPETAEGRVAVAEKIIAEAERHGIPKRDIVVDALTMTLSTNVDNAKITLDAVRHLTEKTGVCTVLGLSNISFGLPSRGALNAGFLALAAYCGLSAAIANPASAAIMDTIAVHKTLGGYDKNCEEYVARFSEQEETAKTQEKRTLLDAVINGLEEEAKKLTLEALPTTDPMEIINLSLIPALDMAGKTFGEGKTFLPQLLKSAAAATSSFEAIRAHMAAAGKSEEKRGKIVLATVKGDIHDIGKNIVKTLLENYNFEVFDLGKNVEPQEIVRITLAENAPLVGLSALMTTTVASMEETIAQLRKAAPAVKIMVGGAVLTAEHAKKIGADHYSPDAMGAVRYAENIL